MSPDSIENTHPQTGTELAQLREQIRSRIRSELRPGQQEMADWTGGPLAVSAVPGSGKSTGMAAAAALAIARHQLHARRQLVAVTFTRSAATGLKAKIRDRLNELSLPPGGFCVYTLHGLALHIATRHRDLSGIHADNITIVSLDRNHRMLRAAVEQWIAAHPRIYQMLLAGRGFDGEETERLRRQSVLRTEVLPTLARTAVSEAKSSGLQPEDLRRMGDTVADDYPILTIAAGLYENYQNLLRSRESIDYDDTIWAALRVLENDSVRRLWQTQVFGVFEDEAQDSSPLQAQLLTQLAANPENPELLDLVRVGDPNQAINSTFTPADPIYFRQFCGRCQTQGRLATIDRAGRSTARIMEAANFTLDWVNLQWQTGRWRESDEAIVEPPFQSQHVRPVGPDDPQPNANPKAIGGGLEIYTPPDIYRTIESIGQRAIDLFEADPKTQAAVLVRTNEQGRVVATELERLYGDRLAVYDVGSGNRRTRVPMEILALLQFIDRPHSPDYLKSALTTLVDRKLVPTQDLDALASLPEQFLYPGPLDPLPPPPVKAARHLCCSLLRARIELPLSHLIAFLGLTLQYDRDELATAEKIGERVAREMVVGGDTSLPAMLNVLTEIVTSERFEPIETEETESVYTRSNQLTIITMHKAKGLDWDCVFLPFLHERLIPGNLRVLPQAKFLGDFTLAEVARAQIRTLLRQQEMGATHPGENRDFRTDPDLQGAPRSWQMARQLKIAEEFRLLYVAMTRAKQLLWMSAAKQAPFTWNKPENLEDAIPCPVLVALQRQFSR
ncbi:MAG: ATP-dependent helicase [Cyanobacteriota bacterium]|nr:ATP-dependent helicase [Cyanobacteriota bacterium]